MKTDQVIDAILKALPDAKPEGMRRRGARLGSPGPSRDSVAPPKRAGRRRTTSSSTTTSSGSSTTSRSSAGACSRGACAPSGAPRRAGAASSSPTTATTSRATTSATSTGTSTSASIGCSSASTRRRRTSPSTSSSTRARRWAFGGGEKLRYAKRVCAALAYVGLANLDRVSIVSTSDRVMERMPQTRGKARIFKVFRFLRGARAHRHDRPRRRPQVVRRAEQAPRPRGAHQRPLRPARLRARHQRPSLQQVRPLRRPRRRPARRRKPKLHGDVLLYDCETGDEREVTVTAKVLERFGEAHRAVPGRHRALLRDPPGPVHRGRRRRPLRRADPARVPARRVPPVAP